MRKYYVKVTGKGGETHMVNRVIPLCSDDVIVHRDGSETLYEFTERDFDKAVSVINNDDYILY